MIGRIGSVLGSADQVEKDRRAVRIFESDEVQRAVRELEALYAADPAAGHADALSTVADAAAATAMSNACGVCSRDPDRPVAYWSVTTPHQWGDLLVPLSGAMIDNPDNIYRTVPVDGLASYKIIGKMIGKGPTQETFVLHEERSGAKKGEQVRSNERETGAISLHELELDADGGFTITIDQSPAGGRINHLQSNPDVRDGYILIRSTLADWSINDASKLEVARLSGPPIRPVADEQALARQAAELTLSIGPYWLAWCRKHFYDRPGNAITHSFARVSGWGHISCGHYELAADEALVVHLEPRGAAYLGFQLSDAWGQGQGTPYIERLGSLNGSQARPHGDGSYSYVIALSDPGVHNWLDPIGLRAGTFAIRWQLLPPGVGAADAIRNISLVKLSALRTSLPDDTAWCTPVERAVQLRERKSDYVRRLNL